MRVCAQIKRFCSSDQNRFCPPFFTTIMCLNNVHDRWWILSAHAIARQSRETGRIPICIQNGTSIPQILRPKPQNTTTNKNHRVVSTPFLKNTVLGKTKYGAFSHEKSRGRQLTSSHQSMPSIYTHLKDPSSSGAE
jgi:hypothetical protein